MQIVNENKEKYEPWGDLVDEVLLSHVSRSRTDQFAEQENDDVNSQFVQNCTSDDEVCENDNIDFQANHRPVFHQDPNLNFLPFLPFLSMK